MLDMLFTFTKRKNNDSTNSLYLVNYIKNNIDDLKLSLAEDNQYELFDMSEDLFKLSGMVYSSDYVPVKKFVSITFSKRKIRRSNTKVDSRFLVTFITYDFTQNGTLVFNLDNFSMDDIYLNEEAAEAVYYLYQTYPKFFLDNNIFTSDPSNYYCDKNVLYVLENSI